MRQIFGILLLLICFYLPLSAQQVSDAVAVLLNKDNHEMAVLRLKATYLPQNLRGDIAVMDSLLDRICKDSNKVIDCPKMNLKIRLAKKLLLEIAEDIESVQKEIARLEIAFQEQRTYISTHPDITVKVYQQYRKKHISPGLSACNHLFGKIKRKEGLLLKSVFRYIKREYWSANPMVTTVVRNYLEGLRADEFSAVANEAGKMKTELEQTRKTIAQLQQQKQEVAAQKYELEQTNDSLKTERIALNYQKMILDLRIGSSNDSIQYLRKTISSIDALIRHNDLKLAALGDSIRIIEQQKTLTETHLNTSKHELVLMQGSLDAMADSMTKMEQQLLENQDRLSNTEERLSAVEASKKRNRLSFIVISVLLGLLILFQLYQRLQVERQARKKLQQVNEQLEDKGTKLEALLRELHHRTKNNLQQVSALLFLQGRDAKDDNVKTVLAEARSRIDALGMVHRQLYQDKRQRFDTVNVSNYIGELVAQLLTGNNSPKVKVITHFDIPNCRVDTDTIIQIGLIVNELVQNCCKYAFPGNANPKLSITVKEQDGLLDMTVRDNGPGLPEDFNPQHTKSFGLKLVNMLSKNTLTWATDQGAVFRLKMPTNIVSDELNTTN